MQTIIPWKDLCEAIEPYHPKPFVAGRRAIGIDRMLAYSFPAAWVQPLGPRSAGSAVRLARDPRVRGDRSRPQAGADEAMICKFRHLMQKHNLGDQLSQLMSEYLQESGLKLSPRNDR